MKKLLLSVVFILPYALFAQEGDSRFQDEYAMMVQGEAGKIEALAQVIPEDKYGWSPMEGVRSVGQVIAHVTSANYFFSNAIGFPAEGVDPRSFEQNEMSKEDAIANLKASYEHLANAGKSISDEDLEEKIDFFGQKMSKRSIMFVAMNHVSEHMGQMIAYARSNNIVPPWSQ